IYLDRKKISIQPSEAVPRIRMKNVGQNYSFLLICRLSIYGCPGTVRTTHTSFCCIITEETRRLNSKVRPHQVYELPRTHIIDVGHFWSRERSNSRRSHQIFIKEIEKR
ncbi:hypothetical protein NECAME_11030, partial [Necator americanus]